MKKLFPLLIVLMPLAIHAQEISEKVLKKHQEKVAESKVKGKVILSLDTIFNKGLPYALLKGKKKGLTTDYSLQSLAGKELMLAVNECQDEDKNASGMECYVAFLFLKSGKRGETQISIGERIERIIVENDLVKDGDINPDGENRFLMQNPPKYSNKTNQPVININIGGGNNNAYQTVERKRSGDISVMGSEIRQDFKVIGTYSKSSGAARGTVIYTLSFFLPDGTKVAEATGEGINAKTWKVVTMKDNRSNFVNTTMMNEAQEIAKYLSDNYYL